RLTTADLDLGFDEFNDLAAELDRLTGRLRDIAVDRDLLEFEIRLLEKFVITSEVVRDWRDYISSLLVEINRVVNTYTLFSIFKLEEEAYDLEIFWRGTPAKNTRLLLENVVRKSMVDHKMFSGPAEVAINHNVSDVAETLPEIDEETLQIRTKTLFVEQPKIGGIVGIGVHSETAIDPTRMLVVESILSTLLNVVGSVKAIYKYTQDLEYYATRDPLTNLYNQRVFWELLGYEIGRAERGTYKFALLVIDFDNFKTINDTYGHGFGDQCLQQFARAIRGALRRPDILCRYGGDEFVAILPEASEEQPFLVGERVRVAIRDLLIDAPDGQPVKVTVSIGCSVFPDHATEAKDLFLFADNMMYKAKAEGKDRLSVPSQDDVIDVFRRIGEKGMLINNAIEQRRVVPYFQPICDTRDGHVAAYEVLGRIDLGAEDGKVLTADEFITAAEQMGVVHRLDFITIEKALAIVGESDYEGLLFLNLSPKNLVLRDFLGEIRRMVNEYGIAPERIVFEITERDTVRNLTLLKNFLNDLKADGFKFAIDDFGSGYSSFHYLKHFPIDFIKIEGDFVASMVRDRRDHAFVKSIATLAEELGIVSVAEFIEDGEIYRAVQQCGIDLAQGYHVGRPARSLEPPAELPPGTDA
ncbi:MAG: bifunctional diguanylate cyclase/phosphodiesterase, partial [Gammaproteobacteria bacterium]|nr:bifunctional diguanylate cyclase/phosphodiesterase [Gammaproteobacteria bacterium]